MVKVLLNVLKSIYGELKYTLMSLRSTLMKTQRNGHENVSLSTFKCPFISKVLYYLQVQFFSNIYIYIYIYRAVKINAFYQTMAGL